MLGEGLGTGRGGSKLSDLALMQQRLSAGRHNEAQTAFTEAQTTGQLSKNAQVKAQVDAMTSAANDPAFLAMFGNPGLGGLGAANVDQIDSLVDASIKNKLLPGQLGQQQRNALSDRMLLGMPTTVEGEAPVSLSNEINLAAQSGDQGQLSTLMEILAEGDQFDPSTGPEEGYSDPNALYPTASDTRRAFMYKHGKESTAEGVYSQAEANQVREKADLLARYKITENGKIEKIKSENILAGVKYTAESVKIATMMKNALDATTDIYGKQLTLQAALDKNKKELEAANYSAEQVRNAAMMKNALEASTAIYDSQLTLQAALDQNRKVLEGTTYTADRVQEAEMLKSGLEAAAKVYDTQLTLEGVMDSNQKVFEASMIKNALETTAKIYGHKMTLQGTIDQNNKVLKAAEYESDKSLEGSQYESDKSLESSMFDTAAQSATNVHKTLREGESADYSTDKTFESTMFGTAAKSATDIYEINKRAETNNWTDGKKVNTNKTDRFGRSGIIGKGEKQLDWSKTRQFLEVGQFKEPVEIIVESNWLSPNVTVTPEWQELRQVAQAISEARQKNPEDTTKVFQAAFKKLYELGYTRRSEGKAILAHMLELNKDQLSE